jgi:hypothetical protein
VDAQTRFSFDRFVELLRRALEACIVATGAGSWVLVALYWRRLGDIRRVFEVLDGVFILSLLLFVLIVVYSFCVIGRRAVGLALRAVVYIVLFGISVRPLSLGSVVVAQRPNQAMQRTAGRSAFSLQMTSTFNQQPHAPSPAVADLVSR